MIKRYPFKFLTDKFLHIAVAGQNEKYSHLAWRLLFNGLSVGSPKAVRTHCGDG
jgi:hypothetical protein